MSHALANCNCGRVAAYTAYNLGGGILVGFARTLLSVAYIARHTFYSSVYETARQIREAQSEASRSEKSEKRQEEIDKATKERKQATGLGKLPAWGKELVAKAKQAAGTVVDKIGGEIEELEEEVTGALVSDVVAARKALWYAQLRRGIAEIFYVGAPLYTYWDNFSDRSISLFGRDEIRELIKQERELNQMVQVIVGREHYNPLF